MNTFQRMCAQLKSTNLYRLDGTTLVEAEMNAYANVFGKLVLQIEELLQNGFLDVVDGTMTHKFDILFGLPVDKFSTPEEILLERKEKIKLMKRRLNIRNTHFTLQAMKEQLELGGIKAELVENPTTKKVNVTILEDKNYFSSHSQKIAFIKSVFPCHVTPVVTFLE